MKKITGLALLVPLLVSTGAYAQLKIENPIGGWRVGSGNTDVMQEVHYPASTVNMRGRRDTSQMIRGSIRNHPKGDRKPITLVVNGLDMPLRPEGESFARPYAFGQGSNTVVVKDGKEKHAVQFYETNRSTTPARLRVLLSWDTDGTDLDLHLVTPDGEHIYYGSRTAPSGAGLDIDVTSGYGPEIISAPSPRRGTYLVYVNYYGGRDKDLLTTGKVSIVMNAGTPDEKIESSLVPLRAPGELNLVKTFRY